MSNSLCWKIGPFIIWSFPTSLIPAFTLLYYIASGLSYPLYINYILLLQNQCKYQLLEKLSFFPSLPYPTLEFYGTLAFAGLFCIIVDSHSPLPLTPSRTRPGIIWLCIVKIKVTSTHTRQFMNTCWMQKWMNMHLSSLWFYLFFWLFVKCRLFLIQLLSFLKYQHGSL